MELLRIIRMWLGMVHLAEFSEGDNGSGSGGGNTSIWFNHSSRGRPNAPTASLVHHPGTVAWVGRPHKTRGQFTVRLRYDTPEARAAALHRLTTRGRVATLTVPVIPRDASPLQENGPAEVGLRW